MKAIGVQSQAQSQDSTMVVTVMGELSGIAKQNAAENLNALVSRFKV